MRSDSAIDRLSRVLDLVPLLAAKSMKVEELALKFGSDIKTIRRDLEIAFLCGLPGYTPDLLIDIDLEGETVSVLNPQVLDAPRQLGVEEVSILLLGLELVRILMPTSPHVLQAIDSLKLKLDPSHHTFSEPVITDVEEGIKASHAIIEEAMLKNRSIEFDYIDTLGSISSRSISVLGITRRSNRLMLEGFDNNKSERRFFFVRNMTNLRVSDQPATTPKTLRSDSEQFSEVKIVFSDLPGWWIRRNSAFIEHLSHDDRGTVVVLRYWNNDWLIRAVTPVLDRLIDLQGRTIDLKVFKMALLSQISDD